MSPTLKLGSYEFPLGKRTLIMGILNITPDSFSDGGKFNEPDHARRQAYRMAEEGADIIDVGGESTRPGSVPVTPDEELKRVIPIIHAVLKEINLPVSIDTYKAVIAEKAMQEGVHMVNDVWGFKADPEMAAVVARHKAPICLMHNRKEAAYRDLMAEVISDLKESIDMAEKAGITKDNVIIDPGIGFGKTLEHNLEVMHRLSALKSLGYPVLLGTSRKSMIGKTLDLPVEERLEGTAATIAYGITAGTDIIRVHDVKEMRRVAIMTDAMVRRNGDSVVSSQ